MSDYGSAIELMGDLGPLLDPDAIIFYPDQGMWSVVVDTETRVDLGYDDAARVLVFTLDLGPIPEAAAADVHKMLLRFGYLWRETGGIHAALDGEGHAALMYKRPLAGLDVQSLRSLIGNLAIQRRLWADLINAPPKDDEIESAIGVRGPLGGIRV